MLEKDNIKKVLECPEDMSVFLDLDGDIRPYDKFFYWASELSLGESHELLFGPIPQAKLLKHLSETFGASVSDYWLCDKKFRELEKLERQFLLHKKLISKHQIEQSLPWHNLNCAPSTFSSARGEGYRGIVIDWADESKVYVKKFEKER